MNRRLELLLFLSIVFLAGMLRMGWPGITEFKLDEARVYKLALDLVEFKSLPLAATDMSVGLPNSPMTVYIYALPMFLWKSPLSPLLFGAALNTAAVALAYGLVRRYWGVRAALISALLYAVAPWAAVIYSRKIIASNLLPFFTVGYVFSGLLAFVEGRRRWVPVHLVLLSVIVQIHISSVVLAPVTAGLLWVYRKRVDWRLVGLGLAGALALEAPFGLYLLTRGGQIGGSAPTAWQFQVSTDVFWLTAIVVSGTYSHSITGPLFLTFNASLPDFAPLFWLGGWAVLLGGGRVLYSGWSEWQSPTRPAGQAHGLSTSTQAGLVVVCWLMMPLIFFVARLAPVQPHYLTILFTLSFGLAGIFWDWLLSRCRVKWQQVPVLLVPLALAGCQTWQSLALIQFVGTHYTRGAFGVPVAKLLQVVDTARQLAPEVLVVSPSRDTWSGEMATVFDALLHGTSARFVDGRTVDGGPMTVLPGGDTVVILWPSDYPASDIYQQYQQWSGGQWAAVVPLRPGEGEVYLAKGRGSVPVPRPLEASALLSNGVEVLGSGGDSRRWELWWRSTTNGDSGAVNYQVFAHLLDANGKRVEQMDGPTYATRDWRAGDVIVNYFNLGGAGAEAGVAVRAGMYTYPSLAPVSVLDVDGNPAGDYLMFALPR